LWCGRNEGDPPPAIDKGNQKIMDELDPARLYQPSSTRGRGVISHGPYCWRTPREYYEFSDKEAFKTEIGSVSIPTLEAVHAMMPEKDWEHFNDDWAEHDLCPGAQQGKGSPYPTVIARRFGRLANLADFVRKSQLANYESFRAMYEGRLTKLFKPCTAVITWMSNPAQPSFVWQLYSHDLEPNSSLFAVRKACEPVHIQMNESNFHVMVVNNLPAAQTNLEARIRVFNLDGTVKLDRRAALNAAASAATDAGLIDFPADLSPVHFVKLELRDSSRQIISDNFYWHALPAHPDDLTELEKLPTAALDVRINRHDDGGKCLLDVNVTNPTSVLAVMAHIQLRRQESNERVLPVYYSDNYISLLPGESKTIQVEAAASDLHGEKPLVVLDGWNVSANPADGVGNNVEALPSSWPANGFGMVSAAGPVQ
jgi:beta-mannosidase